MTTARMVAIATLLIGIFVALFQVFPVSGFSEILNGVGSEITELMTLLLSYFFFFVDHRIFNLWMLCIAFWLNFKLVVYLYDRTKDTVINK